MTFSSAVIEEVTSTVSAGITATGAAGTNASVSNAGTPKDRILNFTIPRGNTGLQGIQGIQGVQGPAGISSNVFVYTFSTNTTTPPPSGHIHLNNTNPNLATSLYVNHIDKKGYDNDVLYANINPNSKLILQKSNDSNTFIEYNVTNKIINTGYIEFVIEYQEKGGTVANNDEILLITQLSGLTGPQGEQGLSSSVFDYKIDRLNFNTTGMTSGTIRFNNADLTLSTEMYVHYLTEFGKDFQRMISLFPTHSRIIIQDKATANYILYYINDLIVRTANQFITIPIQVVQNINQASLTNNLSVYLINQSGTIGLDGPQGPQGEPGPTGPAGSSTDPEYTFTQASYYGTVPTFNLFNMATGAVTGLGGSVTIGTHTGINQLTKTYHVKSNPSSTVNGADSGWVGASNFQPFFVGQGFKITYSFGLLDTTTNAATRTMIGFGNFNAAAPLSTTETVLAVTNQFLGIIQEVGENVFSFYSKGPGASGITPIASTVPCTTTNTGWYTVTFHNDANSSNVIITIKYIIGGVITSSTQTITCGGANTLSTSQACYPLLQRAMASAGGTTGSAILAMNGLKFYTR